ncbi:YkvA family protein [Conexibacter sp. SYSU D00693]|uniref:YkvA family protein n=1 Tax=Conexibacter sp. SYSU D00693 TaxID=2812560 RepID=UPI00196ABB4E|nr:DUF1232 domain-containing protein [Conexibacter sp. SYSU D00693]
MAGWLVVVLAVLGVYVLFVAGLVVAGRAEAARALAGFVPDCARLVAGLARDPAVPRVRRWSLVALALYLASPLDLVPDVIPVAGQLDDAILLAVALRGVVRSAGTAAVRRHWHGPEAGLRVVLALARSRQEALSLRRDA